MAGMYSNGNKFNLECFFVVGLYKSYSFDNFVIDFVVGVMVFSVGQKIYNGVIGVDFDIMVLYIILEEVEDQGLVIGLVVIFIIVYVMFVFFIVYEVQWSYYEVIVVDFLDIEVDFFIGGGKKYFDCWEDDCDFLEEFWGKGYYVSFYFEECLDEFLINYQKNLVYFIFDSDLFIYE